MSILKHLQRQQWTRYVPMPVSDAQAVCRDVRQKRTLLTGLAMSAVYVVRMLCNGWQSPQKLTLSGTIRSKGKLAAVIGRQMMVDSVTVDSLLNSDAFLEQFGFNSENVFALFLPDTYYMYWTATPEEIFSRFRKEYDIFWNGRRLELAASQDLTPMEVSTLASIVNGALH